MSARTERHYPVVVAFLVTGLFLFICRDRSFNDKDNALKELFQSTLNISGIAIGFIATAQAILLSIDQRRVIIDLKAGGDYNKLIQYLMSGIQWGFFLAVVSGAGILLHRLDSAHQKVALAAAWVFTLSVTTMSCYRVVRLLAVLLKVPEKRPGQDAA